MARKAVERNISYDDVRQLYYVSMELGRDENGKRIKQYRTFSHADGRPERAEGLSHPAGAAGAGATG